MHAQRSFNVGQGFAATVFSASVLVAGWGAAAGFEAKKEGGRVTILARGDGRPVVEYRFTDVARKPYASLLFTPGGVQVLRDAPADHLHHHALMFAVSVDGVDFWSENAACGLQLDRGVENRADGAGFTQTIDWVRPDQQPLAQEERELDVHDAGDLGATLITWQTQLRPAAGKDSITLGGSHYFGLGMRFVESMDKDGRLITPGGGQGEAVRGTEQLLPAAWCAYTASADGKPVTVALFDDPKNVRHPARMFTMTGPFAYLSATLNLSKEPLEVKAAEPLTLRYGVAAWDGAVEPARIEAAYKRWVELGSGK